MLDCREPLVKPFVYLLELPLLQLFVPSEGDLPKHVREASKQYILSLMRVLLILNKVLDLLLQPLDCFILSIKIGEVIT